MAREKDRILSTMTEARISRLKLEAEGYGLTFQEYLTFLIYEHLDDLQVTAFIEEN